MKLNNLFVILWFTCIFFIPKIGFASNNNATIPLRPSDFAYGQEIIPPHDGTLFKVDLKEDIYKNLTSPYFNDIRIFNRDGQNVPFLLQSPKINIQNLITTENLTFFPIQTKVLEDAVYSDLQLNQDLLGNLSIQTKHIYNKNPSDKIDAYIIDLRKNETFLKSLEFDWDDLSTDKSILNISVEASDDLKHWRTIAQTQPLMNLRYGSETLIQNKIELPAIKTGFLRIHWTPLGDRNFELKTIKGNFTSLITQPITYQWTKLIPQKTKESSEKLSFDTKAFLPITALNLKLPTPNTVLKVQIYSRNTEQDPWRYRANTVFFRLDTPNGEITSPPLEISLTTDKLWSIQLENNTQVFDTLLPTLELGWLPHECVFLNKGPGPFILAYGNAMAPPLNFTEINFVMNNLNLSKNNQEQETLMPKQASFGTVQTLGGEQRLTFPAAPLPWKTWGIWASFCIVLLIIGRMAWKLFKELEKS